MGKKLSDSEIMTTLLDTIRYKAPEFSEKLGYKSAASIYNVINEFQGTKISKAMANRIVEVFPNVNYLFLVQGQLPVLVDDSMAVGQKNLFGLTPEKIRFEDVPKILKEILSVLEEIRDK